MLGGELAEIVGNLRIIGADKPTALHDYAGRNANRLCSKGCQGSSLALSSLAMNDVLRLWRSRRSAR
jgi:hypothetical protein